MKKEHHKEHYVHKINQIDICNVMSKKIYNKWMNKGKHKIEYIC